MNRGSCGLNDPSPEKVELPMMSAATPTLPERSHLAVSRR
jgi:hypothetical protein